MHKITICCQEKTLKEWSKIYGIPYPTLFERYKKGWPVEKIISLTPNKRPPGNYKITPERESYRAMKARCYYKKNDHYYAYGAKGIIVCDRWLESFDNFYQDMGPRPEGFTLDRIDLTKGYSPENCRWADKYTQARNHSKVLNFTICCQTKTLAEWASDYGIKYSTAHGRYRKGLPIEQILSLDNGNYRNFKDLSNPLSGN